MDDKGVLKIGDFGLARSFGSPTKVYTHQVVTRSGCFKLLLTIHFTPFWSWPDSLIVYLHFSAE